jgi:hypothetical protein
MVRGEIFRGENLLRSGRSIKGWLMPDNDPYPRPLGSGGPFGGW